MAKTRARGLWALAAAVGLGACEQLETLTADKPNGTQREAIGDVLAHFAVMGQLVGDPAGASDSDVADVFATEAYFKLLDPKGTMPIASLRQAVRSPIDESCLAVEGDTASWSCDFDYGGNACHVSGQGSEVPDGHYSGMAILSGETGVCAEGMTVTGEFTLQTSGAGAMGAGTLEINQGGAESFGFVAEMQNMTFCDNGLPDGGKLIVMGNGAAASLPFNPMTLKFTGDSCGFAIIE